MVLDRNLCFTAASQLYLDTVGCTMDELAGRYVFDAFPEEPQRLGLLKDAFERALAGQDNILTKVAYSIPTDDGGFREVWWNCRHHGLRGADGTITHMAQHAQDVTAQVQAERLKDAIAQELQHRVGNILSLVSVIARRTAGNATDLADFLKRFEGRIQALSKTHSYLIGNNWDSMTVEKIVSRQLADYIEPDSHQISMTGPDIALNASDAQTLSLAIHELTTNSVKYGALKTPQGVLELSWPRRDDGSFTFNWIETGITVLIDRDRPNGFGSMILDSIVPSQLNGKASRDLGSSEFRYYLDVPAKTTAPT